MSNRATPVTDELYDYIVENFSSEDVFLTELRKEASLAGFPAINIAPEQGRYLQFFLKSISAKYVLEIGTLAGYSAITMARALPEDGRLITVEYESERAEYTRNKVAEAGLEHIVEVYNADGKEFLKNFKPDFKLDFVFVDADKPSYSKYLDLTTPLLRVGGVAAFDNAFAFGFLLDASPERDPADIKSIVKFNEYFKNHPDYLTTIVPVGDGMIMGFKNK